MLHRTLPSSCACFGRWWWWSRALAQAAGEWTLLTDERHLAVPRCCPAAAIRAIGAALPARRRVATLTRVEGGGHVDDSGIVQVVHCKDVSRVETA